MTTVAMAGLTIACLAVKGFKLVCKVFSEIGYDWGIMASIMTEISLYIYFSWKLTLNL